MKVGTVPKITVGVAALIVLIFIGFVGIRQMRAPIVEERVYLSPWEDGTPRPQNNSEELAVQTDSAQDTENRDNPSQIATAASAEGTESVDNSLGESEEADIAQFMLEAEFEPEADQSLSTDTSTLLDDEGRSAEDVMNAYLEAYKNLDVKAMLPLVTGAVREDIESSIPAVEDTKAEIAEAGAEAKQFTEGMLSQMLGRTEIVSREYVGGEFHFRLREPKLQIGELIGMVMQNLPEEHQAAALAEIPGAEAEMDRIAVEMENRPAPSDILVKMRKEDGAWRIYESGNAN